MYCFITITKRAIKIQKVDECKVLNTTLHTPMQILINQKATEAPGAKKLGGDSGNKMPLRMLIPVQ